MIRPTLLIAAGIVASACAPASPSATMPEPASTTMPAVASAPTLPAPPKLVLPSPSEATLANGLTIKLVEMHEVPVVQMVLSLAGGARLDGEMPGLATFSAGMLDEGAGTRDAFALAAELEFLGASLSTRADWDNATISLRAPKRTLAPAMDLMADVLMKPRFAAEDVARQRDLRIAGILQSRDQPGAVASNVFSYSVFPAAHPYHNPIGGDSASTVRLDSTGVRRFWSRVADPAHATLIVTGDITMAEARTLAEAKFGAWTSPPNPLAVPDPALMPPVPARGTRIVLVNKPGAPQSVMMIGGPGFSRGSPDYPAIVLMNTILGGSFSSRLNDILREQKGFTYGAFSQYVWRPLPGPFVASSQVRTDVTDSSLAIVFDEFRRIRAAPVTSAELERAKAYVVLGALGDFETTGQVASSLADLDLYGLPLSTIPAELAAIEQLTAGDLQAAANKYLDPDHLTIVIVGDVPSIRPGIEALGLGPITTVDFMGNEVP